jgi:hypothetical protein
MPLARPRSAKPTDIIRAAQYIRAGRSSASGPFLVALTVLTLLADVASAAPMVSVVDDAPLPALLVSFPTTS